MLRVFCEMAGEGLGKALDARTRVTLESVGLEPLVDVVPEEGSPVCGVVVDLNGIRGAVALLPDGPALFHLVDIMLGADASAGEPVVERPSSPLGDKFCKTIADTLMQSLEDACGTAIGPGSCVYTGSLEVVHDGADLAIAPPKADVMAIELALSFGAGERRGIMTMLVPLTTIDAISAGAGSVGGTQPAYEGGPWFDHMKSSVSLMELDTVALLHTEQMSLAELSRLDIGSIIPLDRESVKSVRIALEDGGDTIASGELGVSSGKRVISLDDAPNEAFLAPVRKLIEDE